MKYLFILLVSYFLPKTDLEVVVHYDETTLSAGPFYQYSERFLGTTNAVTKDQTTYQITRVEVRSVASPDPNRHFELNTGKSSIPPLVCLTNDGILAGYNLDADSKPSGQRSYPAESHQPLHQQRTGSSITLPLLEEQLQASSTAKMAEGAAKLIYRIRESRLALLGGEQEHSPADGRALERTLDELDEYEQELVELFVGKKHVTHHNKTIRYTIPDNAPATSETLLRFSKFYGPVSKDDLSGEAVRLTFIDGINRNIPSTAEEVSSPSNAALYYIEPERVTVSISSGDTELKRHTVKVAQWGQLVGLDADLFNKGSLPHITINPHTGALIQISK